MRDPLHDVLPDTTASTDTPMIFGMRVMLNPALSSWAIVQAADGHVELAFPGARNATATIQLRFNADGTINFGCIQFLPDPKMAEAETGMDKEE